MSEEVNIVDDSDWNRIESLMKAAVDPLDKQMTAFNDRMDKLPCGEHSISLNTMEVQHKAEREQKKDATNSRDWILRVLVAAVGVMVFLDKIGVFKSFAK